MNLSIENSPAFLHARLSGEFSLGEAERSFMDILRAVDDYHATKVLVDGRAVTGQPTTLERFYYGEFAAEAVAALCQMPKHQMPKFAYVLVNPVIDDQRFGNTVAANRGMVVKTFDDVAAAVAWLTL